MDLDQFFERLPKDGWKLDAGGRIRAVELAAGTEQICPITRLTMERSGLYVKVATQFGLSLVDANEIVRAADGYYSPFDDRKYDPALRARLLAHCGLTESRP